LTESCQNSSGKATKLNDKVSVFSGALNRVPVTESDWLTVMGDIQSDKYRKVIEAGRLLVGDPVAYREYKKNLPAVTFCGVFAPHRDKQNIQAATGFLIPDLDHLADVDAVFDLLSQDEHVYFAFKSPSGNGIKCGVRADGVKTDDDIKRMFAAVDRYFSETYSIKIDPACKDICRLTFISYDPLLFINKNPFFFDVERWQPEPEERFYVPPGSIGDGRNSKYGQKVLDSSCQKIATSLPGDQHNTRLRMARLVGGFIGSGFIDEAVALSALEQAVIASGAKVLHEAMKTIREGIENGKRSPIHPHIDNSRTHSGESTGNYAAEPWETPIPLNCELLPVMTFNPEWLPEHLRNWVKDIAHRMQSPIDYAAVGAMVAYSAIAGKRLAIHPKRYDDWVIVPNLWGCVIGRPSAKKTPALQEVLKPLFRLEYAAKNEYEAENRAWMTQSAISGMQADSAKEKAKKLIKEGKVDEATTLLQGTEDNQNIAPTRKRIVINDASIEKEGEILAENPNGVLLYRDELFGFLKTINREDHANDRAFHLECWAGLGRYTYDRIGRGTIDIENCIESILGCLTPSKLTPLVNMAMTGGVDDDGFIQRFQLMVYPDDIQFKYVDEIPDKDARDTAYEFFKYVSGLSFEPVEYEKIPYVHFSKEAQKVFSEWLSALEMEIARDDIHPAIESHLAKYRSLIPSLALLIHFGSDDDPAGDVQLDSLKKAISWGLYLKSHALRVYGLAINNAAHLGKLLLDKIRAGKLTDPFVIRDVKRPQWHGLTSEGAVESALKVLVDAGYLRIKTSPTGGKEKIEYFVNPKIFSENAQGNN
jgi:putative DNA primase/helicase